MAILSPNAMFRAFQASVMKSNTYAKDIVCEGRPYCELYATVLNGRLRVDIQTQIDALQQAATNAKSVYTFSMKTDKASGLCTVSVKDAGTRAKRSDAIAGVVVTKVSAKALSDAQNEASAAHAAKASAVSELASAQKDLRKAKLEIERLGKIVSAQNVELAALRKMVGKPVAQRMRTGVLPVATVAA